MFQIPSNKIQDTLQDTEHVHINKIKKMNLNPAPVCHGAVFPGAAAAEVELLTCNNPPSLHACVTVMLTVSPLCLQESSISLRCHTYLSWSLPPQGRPAPPWTASPTSPGAAAASRAGLTPPRPSPLVRQLKEEK